VPAPDDIEPEADDPVVPDAVEPAVDPALPEPDVPDVPAVDPDPPLVDPMREPDPVVALARMYDPLADEDADAVDDPLPDAPLIELLFSMHPVTVTVFPLPVLLLVPLCDVPLCADAPTPHPAVTAIASAAIYRFMV